MVTVKIGNETLRGVLYHVQQQPSPAASNLASATPESSSVPGAGMARTRRRRRRGWRRRDPAHPKPNRSAYNFFFAEKHSKLKALYPHREREFSKMIGESWSKLSEEERMVRLVWQKPIAGDSACGSDSLSPSFSFRFIRILEARTRRDTREKCRNTRKG